MSNQSGLVCPFIVQDNMTRKTHTVTSITDTSAARYYWIDGKSYLSSAFTILSVPKADNTDAGFVSSEAA